MKLLECVNLEKKFGDRTVLKDVNLVIPRGKIIGLLGKNGTGKTTLIKLINGLLTSTSGKVLVNEKEIGVESKIVISYLPERTYLDKSMTVEQVINFFKDFYSNFDEEKARKLLKDLDLDTSLKLSKMSKGMQEKVQLVLVMSRKADLYILDEPLGGVDPATRDYILDTILTNFNEGASVIISTHLIADIERILDEVIFIDKGEIKLVANSDELRTKENSEDYRYFPDPDLLAVNISDEEIQKIKDTMPMLPNDMKKKYLEEYGLNEYDTDVILAEKEVSDLYSECLKDYFQPKSVVNQFATEILARIKGGNKLDISKENLVWIIKSVDEKKIQRNSAKDLLTFVWGTNLNAEVEAKKQGIMADLSSDIVFEVLDKILKEKADVVAQFKAEQDPKILNFLVGQVMRETRGKANAGEVMEKIKEKIM